MHKTYITQLLKAQASFHIIFASIVFLYCLMGNNFSCSYFKFAICGYPYPLKQKFIMIERIIFQVVLIIGFSVVVLHGTKGWMKGKYSILNGLFTPVQRQNIAHGGHTRVREYELFTHKYLSRSGWLRVTKSNSLSHPSSASLTSFLLASIKILTWFIVLSVFVTDKLL